MTGLCGNFNGNINDDSLTPSGDDNKNVTEFASEWQTNAKCNIDASSKYRGACSHSIQFEEYSKQTCSQLREGSYGVGLLFIVKQNSDKI